MKKKREITQNMKKKYIYIKKERKKYRAKRKK